MSLLINTDLNKNSINQSFLFLMVATYVYLPSLQPKFLKFNGCNEKLFCYKIGIMSQWLKLWTWNKWIFFFFWSVNKAVTKLYTYWVLMANLFIIICTIYIHKASRSFFIINYKVPKNDHTPSFKGLSHWNLHLFIMHFASSFI